MNKSSTVVGLRRLLIQTETAFCIFVMVVLFFVLFIPLVAAFIH